MKHNDLPSPKVVSRRNAMMGRIVQFSIVLAGLCVSRAGFASEDWSQWRGAHRDALALGVHPPEVWPQELLAGWRVEVGLGHASPVLTGDRVFIFTRQDHLEVVRALRLADGKELWKKSYEAPYEVNPPAEGQGKGPKSTPAIAGDRLFTVGISGIVSAWNVENGDLLWSKDFSKQFKDKSPLYGTATSPLVDGKRLIVHLGGHDHGAVMALDVSSGKVVWTWEEEGPAHASPIIAELSGTRQIVTQTQGAGVGLDLEDGDLLWKIPLKSDNEDNSVTPVVYEGTVLFSGYNKGMARYRVEKDDDGAWTTDFVWGNKEVSLSMSSPVASGERLFGFSHYLKGQLFALDITTGRTLWTSEGHLADNAVLVRTEDVIWALTTQAELIAFRDTGKQYRPLARYKVAETPTWAYPVILNDGLLVKDENEIIQWKFPPPSPAPAPDRAGKLPVEPRS